MRRTRGRSLSALVAAAAIAGCGGGSSSSAPDLANPVAASCDPPGFQHSPPTRHIDQGHPSGWQLSYRIKFSNNPKETTNIVLIEESPQLPANGVTGGHPVTVKGRHVSLKSTVIPPQSHVAQWETAKARYIAISNGATPTRLEQLIACLP